MQEDHAFVSVQLVFFTFPSNPIKCQSSDSKRIVFAQLEYTVATKVDTRTLTNPMFPSRCVPLAPERALVSPQRSLWKSLDCQARAGLHWG